MRGPPVGTMRLLFPNCNIKTLYFIYSDIRSARLQEMFGECYIIAFPAKNYDNHELLQSLPEIKEQKQEST